MVSIRNGGNNGKATAAASAIEWTYSIIEHLIWLLAHCLSLIVILLWLIVASTWDFVQGPVPYILGRRRTSVWFLPFLAWQTYRWAIMWWAVLGHVSPSAQQLGRDVAVAVVCPIPALSSSLALCEVRPPPLLLLPLQPFNMTKITSSREELVAAVGHLSEHQGLTTGLFSPQSAVRDLSSRVAASNLPRKHEVLYDLEALIHNTWNTAK
jgi:hypothetical protein